MWNAIAAQTQPHLSGHKYGCASEAITQIATLKNHIKTAFSVPCSDWHTGCFLFFQRIRVVRIHDCIKALKSKERNPMAKKNTKVTSKKAASSASKTLTTKTTGKASKSAAGSALSQTKAPSKQTSKKAATAASKTLKDGRTSKASKSAAGSALAQKASKSKKGKK